MNFSHIKRKIDGLQSNIGSEVSLLLQIIEELQKENEKLQERYDSLQEIFEELKEQSN